MKRIIEQFKAVFKAMPVSKKISMAVVLGLVVAGFALMFLWTNQVDYQVLYSNLSQEDAANIVPKLKEQHIPYKLEGGGSVIMVPAEKVYETRLALAGERLPSGGNVGFEIFDQTSFSTTEFVQRLNYQRALQGELSRTIGEFREVDHARVLIVMPKDSLFIEDTRPPSASVLLKLRSGLSQDKVAGIVHIVASAVEALAPEHVTVVDTTGKVLFKGPNQGDQAALFSSNKLDYQREVEGKIERRVQSMMESIVGVGKAVVRVSAEIDFDQTDLSEEKYDPDNTVIRSRQRRVELSEKGGENALGVVSVDPGQPVTSSQQAGTRTKSQKEDDVTNYEINRVTRHVIKPSGTVNRLSVAAVVDGTYEVVTAEDGSKTEKYVPRTSKELEEFEKIVKRAMGFDADREDQVHVSCFPLSISAGIEAPDETGTDWLAFGRQYIRPAINLVLIVLIFLFIARPLFKSVKGIVTTVDTPKVLPQPSQEAVMPDALPDTRLRDTKEKTILLAKDNPEKAFHVIKAWMQEGE
jgi:flagellar M-ring protein FliF